MTTDPTATTPQPSAPVAPDAQPAATAPEADVPLPAAVPLSDAPVSAPAQLRVMVASSVYGFEDGLNQIVATLRIYGYTVWNSHTGTIPTDPRRSNLENCLEAVRQCDVFVGLIRQSYGSGVIGETSITHEEMRLAVELDKPRWVLAHENVFLARQLLRPFLPHFARPGSPPPPKGLLGWLRRWGMDPVLPQLPSLRNNPVIDDLRILDMFAEMTRMEEPVSRRTGNWVQQYRNVGDVLVYLETNLSNIEFVRTIVREGQA